MTLNLPGLLVVPPNRSRPAVSSPLPAGSPAPPPRPGPHPRGRIVLGGLGLLGAAVAITALVRPGRPGLPPAAIAADPVLARGFEIYSAQCLSCHGPLGRGDGPIARRLAGPPPRDLVADEWKHGGAPGQVLAVLERGVKESAMPAYGGTYGRADLRATAAYLYHLAGRPIPRELRVP